MAEQGPWTQFQSTPAVQSSKSTKSTGASSITGKPWEKFSNTPAPTTPIIAPQGFNPGGQSLSAPTRGSKRMSVDEQINASLQWQDEFNKQYGDPNDEAMNMVSYSLPVLSAMWGVKNVADRANQINRMKSSFTPEEQGDVNKSLVKQTAKQVGIEAFWRLPGPAMEAASKAKAAAQMSKEALNVTKTAPSLFDKATYAPIVNQQVTEFLATNPSRVEIAIAARQNALLQAKVAGTKIPVEVEVAKLTEQIQPYLKDQNSSAFRVFTNLFPSHVQIAGYDKPTILGRLPADMVNLETRAPLAKSLSEKLGKTVQLVTDRKTGGVNVVWQPNIERDVALPMETAMRNLNVNANNYKKMGLELRKQFGSSDPKDMKELFAIIENKPIFTFNGKEIPVSITPAKQEVANQYKEITDKLFKEFNISNYRADYVPHSKLPGGAVRTSDLPKELRFGAEKARLNEEVFNQNYNPFDVLDYYITRGFRQKFVQPAYDNALKATEAMPKQTRIMVQDYLRAGLGKTSRIDEEAAKALNQGLNNLGVHVDAAGLENIGGFMSNALYASKLGGRIVSGKVALLTNSLQTYRWLGVQDAMAGLKRLVMLNKSPKGIMDARMLKTADLSKSVVQELTSGLSDKALANKLMGLQRDITAKSLYAVSKPDDLFRTINYLGGMNKAERNVEALQKGKINYQQFKDLMGLDLLSKPKQVSLVKTLRKVLSGESNVFSFATDYGRTIQKEAIYPFGGLETGQLARSGVGKATGITPLTSYMMNMMSDYTNVGSKLMTSKAAKIQMARILAGITAITAVDKNMKRQLGLGALPQDIPFTTSQIGKDIGNTLKGARTLGIEGPEALPKVALGAVKGVAGWLPGSLTATEVAKQYQATGGDWFQAILRTAYRGGNIDDLKNDEPDAIEKLMDLLDQYGPQSNSGEQRSQPFPGQLPV